MKNNQDYNSKEFTPAQSIHALNPASRLRKPKTKDRSDFRLCEKDMDFLSDFIKTVAFYIEEFEDYIGEDLLDFWQNREYALKIITEAMMERALQHAE